MTRSKYIHKKKKHKLFSGVMPLISIYTFVSSKPFHNFAEVLKKLKYNLKEKLMLYINMATNFHQKLLSVQIHSEKLYIYVKLF